jgi:DNA polymerase III delta subunit
MHKNIIYFNGNDSYGIAESIKRWTQAFQSKYGNANIERIDLENTSLYPQIRDNLIMVWLFSEKRLFICSGGVWKKSKEWGFLEILKNITPNLPDDHFILFYNIHPKEISLIEWLKKEADTRSHDDVWNSEIWNKRFSELDEQSIKQVIQLYSLSERTKEESEKNPDISHQIGNTLEILELMNPWERTDEYIREIVHTNGGGKIFDLVDAINSRASARAIQIFRKIIETTKTREFLPSLIGLMRNSLYIKYLHQLWLNEAKITQTIKVHPFVLKKTLQSSISFEKISEFYKNLVLINKAYKSGKWLQDSELWK